MISWEGEILQTRESRLNAVKSGYERYKPAEYHARISKKSG